ncbi:MAG: hypothetical protein ACE5DI_04455 [Candidatus Micrarchaeia archaeon]
MNNKTIAALLGLFLMAFMVNAAKTNCVLKVEVESPTSWEYVSEGDVITAKFGVLNLSSGNRLAPNALPAGFSLNVELGNTTTYTTLTTGPNYAEIDFEPYALDYGEVGRVTMEIQGTTGCPGGDCCLESNETKYYYFSSGKARGIPDFNLLILPLLALAALGLLRKR